MIRPTGTHEPSVGHLFKRLATESRNLIQQEIELAKTEMSEKASLFSRNLIFIVVGGAILYAGLLALIGAACVGIALALAQGMDAEVAAWLGPLIVGAVIAIIGYALVQTAINSFKHESFAPRKSIDSLREDREWLHDQMTSQEYSHR